MKRDILVNWFIDNFPEHYSAMLDSCHYVNRFSPNPWHAEGSVWTHTMMVMTWISARYSVNSEDETEYPSDNYTTLLTTGLLHDLGKPTCEELNDKGKNSFKGHEGVSVMLSIEVLKQLKEDFPESYSDEVIEKIIKLIGTHGVRIEGEPSEFRMLRTAFNESDKKGAIRQSKEDFTKQYDKRKFSSIKNVKEDKEIVFMVGMPCSGKSTYINGNLILSHSVVSRDNELMNYYAIENDVKCGDFSYNEAYKFAHKDENKKDFEDKFEKYLNNLQRNHDKIVIDMTMMPMSSRRKMMNKFPNHRRKCVVVMTSYGEMQFRNTERNEKTGKNIPDFVFENMAKSFTYPVKEEGFEEIKLVIN